ncbi:uncharacterized protein [Euphorbia lathyris]|uniref:uncharacterized protein n=1 Tax=Euphorbia lathyris TaxID=212925 RepID=UPI003313932E
MGNGYNHHHHQNINLQQKPTFLPMLCSKPSIKEVSIPRLQNRRSMSFSGDPLSPKISCMGQVKRHNNKINSISTTTPLPLPPLKYSKLKRIFSTKTPKSAMNSSSCREKGTTFNGRRRRVIGNSVHSANSVDSIKIEEMDPPLPVIKKVADGSRENDSLWKRRRSGGNGNGLKNLQLQQIQIQINKHNLTPTTV